MTIKEQIEVLKELQADIVNLHSALEEKKAKFREGFAAMTGLETDKPVQIEKVLEAFEKASGC